MPLAAAVDHVFVLMLENHSFDNVFAMSGIAGITHATTADSNTFAGQTFSVSSPAPPSMSSDPGHEFRDVLEQLCGEGATQVAWQPYPQPINNSGFVANFATSPSGITAKHPQLPAPAQYGDIMKCFATAEQLPVIYQLATEFAVCDHWFASVPGPTWPNRFFVHGASSGGWANTPSGATISKWELSGGGFVYPSGSSIFDALTRAGRQWHVYVDENGPLLGGIPQVAALKGVSFLLHTNPLSRFATDLQAEYPYSYTFIEPNYGDVVGGSFIGGSSQHPLDGVARGEALIKATYEAIRNSPLWNRSLLIITYDEHGGFYDSFPPGSAPAPDDGSPKDVSINSAGFIFQQYGARVPAVVVSPLIARGSVDHTVYDHASVLATLEKLYGLPALTRRDASANAVLDLLSLGAPRTDCPTTLNQPAPAELQPLAASLVQRDVGDQPLPEVGNVHGFLATLHKADLELAAGDPARQRAATDRFSRIKTHADAEAYATEAGTRVRAARASRGARR
ncbi:MAG: phosphoesterase [Chloroflexi bacterium]|nr:phosphoesterase [Chloroflexota bacterium]